MEGNSVALSGSELNRIEAIVTSAMAHDWSRFKGLSDEPFVNDISMYEQFVSSCNDADFRSARVPEYVIVFRDGRKGKMFEMKFENKKTNGGDIYVQVYSHRVRAGDHLRILVLSEIPDFD